jgi:uncharacterized oligopeptide transporter (OPT) family protein
MMDYAAAIFLVLGFIVVLKVLKVVENSARVIGITSQAVSDFRSNELDDDAKETAMQAHAKQLFVLFFLITFGAFSAVFVPLAFVWALDRLQLLSLADVLRATLSWQFIAASTAAIGLILFAKRSR